MILRDFAPYRDSGIRELHASFTARVQIIIGTNGCGKSQTLRQLSPDPVSRGKFEEKKGFKSTVFEKDGTYYRLETDYEKPSSPHLFYEGDNEENINIGRTTETQKELVAEHLGVTPVINDLIMNTYKFPEWGSAKRKEFLMNINPDQIGFMLRHAKEMSAKIKSCKNNLARLSERKILLEQQLVDDETMQQLLEEKQQISDELGAFQKILMDLEVGMRTVGHIGDASLEFIPTLRQTIKRHRYKLATLPHINRDDTKRQHDREDTMTAIAVCRQQLKEKDEEITQLSADLLDMEARYRELASDGDLLMIDATIERLEFERDRLQIDRPAFELSAEDLQQRYRELDELNDRLLLFSNLSVTLLPAKRRQHRERVLQMMQHKQHSWGMRLNDYEARRAELDRRHSVKPRDIPDSPCAKDACPLYSHFMGEYLNTEEMRQKLTLSIDKGRRKITRLDRLVEGLLLYFEQSRPYTEQVQWLVGYAQSNPILHHVLRQLDILAVLSSSPSRIYRQLKDAYDRIEQWHKLKAVMSDLETARAMKSRQISSEDHDTIKLVAGIEKTKQALYGLRSEITDLNKKLVSLGQLFYDINTFNEIKREMLAIRDQQISLIESLANSHEKDRLTVLRRGVEDIRNRHFLRMSDIETTLRTQSGIRERYQEEVVSQMVIIEQELADLQQIEAALIAIPRDNMMGFINSVFNQANLLIDQIWTVPLTIETLTADDTLNYDFRVSGDNNSVRELRECSEGQTEILTLAINLALRIVLKHFNFPLMLDETGRTFDEKHRHNLIMLLKRLMDDNVISQLFLVSHHASIHEAFNDSETMVIREDNIVLPQVYNQHVTMK
jgi:energy-coupling factor transporter ATP-binding protein EcfA2